MDCVHAGLGKHPMQAHPAPGSDQRMSLRQSSSPWRRPSQLWTGRMRSHWCERQDDMLFAGWGEWSSMARPSDILDTTRRSGAFHGSVCDSSSSIGHDESVPSTPAQIFPTWVPVPCLRILVAAERHPADMVRGSVPPDVLSALEQDLCEGVQNSPVQEIGRLVRPHQESVHPVHLKNRFSPLVESHTVIHAPGVFPMTDGAEEEMPPSQSLRRRPTRQSQSVEATMIDPVDEDQEATTDSIHSVPQRRRRRLILNFSREQEEPVDSGGGEGLEQSSTIEQGRGTS